MPINISPEFTLLITNASLIVSIIALTHNVRKDNREEKRVKNTNTIDANNSFLKNTVPKIKAFNQNFETVLNKSIIEVSNKTNVEQRIIKNSHKTMQKLNMEIATQLKINQILNELETLAQSYFYHLFNKEIFERSTYPQINTFYEKYQMIIEQIHQTDQQFEYLVQLHKQRS